MSILHDPLNLLFFAIALYAGVRLWQVLGHGNNTVVLAEKVADRMQPLPTDLELKSNPINRVVWQGYVPEGSDLAKQLSQIAGADARFDTAEFMKTAAATHENILNAFATADIAALKPNLSEKTLVAFAGEIDRRKLVGERANFTFIGLKNASIVSVRLDKNVAEIGVAFTTEMVSAIQSGSGVTLSGDPAKVTQTREVWVFGRDLVPSEQVWRLVETHDAS